MTVAPEVKYRFEQIGSRYGFGMDDRSLEVLAVIGEGLVADCQRLNDLPDEKRPLAFPNRPAGFRPKNEENPVNGWVWKCRVEGAADGPLRGATVGLKDTIALAGSPMLNGSAMLEGFVPTEDATVVARLLEAGATIIGKTAVPAFCAEGAGLIGYPEPLPINPRDHSRLPGASSSGSAAVVANSEVDIALGGDQGGSIRVPASWCGCCGLKPTFGLVPYTGIFPMEMSLDTVGPLASTVRDCARALEVMAGADGCDPRQTNVRVQRYTAALDETPFPLRIGLLTEGFGVPGASEDAVDDTVRRATDGLAGLGAIVQEISVPMHRDGVAINMAIALQGIAALFVGDAIGTNWRGHYWTELADVMGRIRATMAADFPDTLKVLLLAGEYLNEKWGLHIYAKAQNAARALAARYDEALDRFDVLVLPTTPMRAMEAPSNLSELGERERLQLALNVDSAANVAPFNVTGHPALTVPCEEHGALPVGLMVVGRHFDDARVLQVGALVEAVRGTRG